MYTKKHAEENREMLRLAISILDQHIGYETAEVKQRILGELAKKYPHVTKQRLRGRLAKALRNKRYTERQL